MGKIAQAMRPMGRREMRATHVTPALYRGPLLHTPPKALVARWMPAKAGMTDEVTATSDGACRRIIRAAFRRRE